jgi:chemotaxis protein MotB
MKQASAGSNGLLGGSSIVDADSYPNRAGQTGNRAMTIPRDATGGPKEGGERIKQVKNMQDKLNAKLATNPRLQRLAKQVRMIDTTEGIRIDLVDNADFSMFQLGTTVLTPDANQLLGAIGELLTGELGGVSIRGHTDAVPWNGGAGANNWSLSAGRAEATRQALMAVGIGETRFRRIEGVADREPLVQNNPMDPRNRRISILLMR